MIDDYLEQIPGERRQRIEALVAMVRTLYPQAAESLRYRMPTFDHPEGGWVAIANQKQYVSLYTCSAEHLEAFREQHPTIKTGKGCINFRDRDDIPVTAVKAVISSAMEMKKPG